MPPNRARRKTQPPVGYGDAEDRAVDAGGTPDSKKTCNVLCSNGRGLCALRKSTTSLHHTFARPLIRRLWSPGQAGSEYFSCTFGSMVDHRRLLETVARLHCGACEHGQTSRGTDEANNDRHEVEAWLTRDVGRKKQLSISCQYTSIGALSPQPQISCIRRPCESGCVPSKYCPRLVTTGPKSHPELDSRSPISYLNVPSRALTDRAYARLSRVEVS